MGSGERTREKSAKARVKSSIVAVASRKLLWESGVDERESMDMMGWRIVVFNNETRVRMGAQWRLRGLVVVGRVLWSSRYERHAEMRLLGH